MAGFSPTLTQEPIMQMVHVEKVLGGSSSAVTAPRYFSLTTKPVLAPPYPGAELPDPHERSHVWSP